MPELSSNPPSSEQDDAMMLLALEEAQAAFEEDEVPIGAVLVASSGEVIARAHNSTRAESDPTAHAEMHLIRSATRRLGYPRLEGCTVYTTVEPCFMCAGALVHARVARAVWSVRDPKFGGAVSLGNVLDHPGANHRVSCHEGVRAEESRALLQEFFRSKR